METLSHPIPPVYNEASRILILGSFPSVKSRAANFFYGHPQNRFWKLLAALTKSPLPSSVEEKKALLLNNHIALWDVIQSCTIEGSSDLSIQNVVPNNIALITASAPIAHIYANGSKAYDLFMRCCPNTGGLPVTRLPSTSPANASYSFERLLHAWSVIL